jgi:hypothetical protein
MKRLLALLVILALFTTGCNLLNRLGPVDIDPDTDPEIDPDVEIDDQPNRMIDFYDPVELSAATLIEGQREHFLVNKPDYQEGQAYLDGLAEYSSYWTAGTFVDGEYEGRSLLVNASGCDGLCTTQFYRFAADLENDVWTLLAPYSDEPSSWLLAYPHEDIDEEISIPELEAPETLDAYENDMAVLVSSLSGIKEDVTSSEAYELTEISDTSFGEYYKKGNCLYTFSPDGLVIRYSVVPEPFVEGEAEMAIIAKELTFTNLDGETSTKNYSITSGGCGFSSSCITSTEATEEEEAQLEIVGSFGDTDLWMFSEIGEQPEDYTSLLYKTHSAYGNYTYRDERMTIEEYIADGNIFFLKMDNDEYVLVYNADYAPMAECGKPVIYLYPEEETVANVQVGIDEFTVTDPVYGEDGWNVIAESDGTLTNLADGLEYPYLFWEGISEESFQVEEGFTLTKKEIVKVLPSVLMDLGLNETETADFMEFWQPKLLEEKGEYVEFSFIPQNIFDKIAPLTITPAPDKVIRVYMSYKGTDTAGLSVPDFRTPERYGFTVVEWGGDLH